MYQISHVCGNEEVSNN